MSKVSKMDLDEILKITGLTFNENDIFNFCLNKEVIDGFIRVHRENAGNLRKYLLDNEDEIDKEKMVLCLYCSYQKNLNIIRRQIEKLGNSPRNMLEEQLLRNQEKMQTEYLKDICRLGKDIDAYTTVTSLINNEIQCEIVAAKELFQNRRISEKKNLLRWQEIDNELGDNGTGSTYVIQPLILSDLTAIMPDPEIGLKIREYIFCNAILKNRNITYNQLETLQKNNEEEYIKLLWEATVEEYLPVFREEIIRNIRFIDIDKLLLMVGYRLEEALEKENLPKETIENTYSMLLYIKEKIEDKKIVFKETLEERNFGKFNEIEYSYKDMEECIKRFIDGKYIKKSEVSESREKFLKGEITLEALELPFFNLFDIKEDEIEQVMYNSNENFIFGVKALELSESDIQTRLIEHHKMISLPLINFLYNNDSISIDTIINLYSNNLISSEFFKEFSEEKDISSEINLQKINELYTEIKSSEEVAEEKNKKVDAMVELYRVINLEEKEDEEKDEVYREIIEVTEGEEDILFYYDKGLLTLQIVADWSGENAISKLYDQSQISMGDLEELYAQGKINIGLIQNKFTEEGLNYSELLSKIYLGYLSEDKIVDLYMRGKLFDYDFEEMFTNGVVTIQKYLDATSKRTKEELEKNAKIKFEPILVNIPDKKIRLNTIDGEEGNESLGITTERTKTLIDPNIRFEFLKLLGAKEAIAEIEDENNAFYNYEFFVIPDAEGNLQANSVVIAERFYEDKETQDRFATSNATYFFQYKDLMVNSNLSKKEMTQDRENIVFTANHRAGSWAISVLYKIAQTLAGQNFKDYKKGDERATAVIDNLLKIYSKEQLDRVLDLAGRIDDTGEYIYEEVNSSFGKRSHDDDEEVSL